MIIPSHFENLKVLHENTCPNRAYYIPASIELDDPMLAREDSDRFHLLSGNWRFRYYPSIYDLQDLFYEEGYDAASYETVPVPGIWQYYGHDGHQYTNLNYPFPINPPYVPRENPCGAYLHSFSYQKDSSAPNVFLNFEGVDSCFYVWLNGAYVGYSQVSHAPAEFDVTDYIRNGSNTLAVLVLKWCDGSYLEDQDKFRMSGIFRDVYLLARPDSYIRDYTLQAWPDDNGEATVTFRPEWKGEPVPAILSFYDEEGELAAEEEIKGNETVSFALAEPHLWSAEAPYLYRVVIKTGEEVIVDQMGIRKIEAVDGVLLFNDTAIILHGTNRHDSDPKTGYVISPEQLMRDLELMKRYNINAIRTSHYPNSPWAYVLYDRLGFYVIDEADNESHGCDARYWKNWNWEDHIGQWNTYIADNPDWTEATVDRAKLLVTRDKNRPCVIMWSMGNECAYGCTFEAALKWTKRTDPTRLTHYESARYVSDTHKYDYSNLDTYSRMYPSLAEMKDYLEHDQRKPFVLCEYCHAMGNGPGDLEDYFAVIHRYDCACGGMIWEWCDHAIYEGTTTFGKARYAYGGDHGELLHDGNFCMDGLVYPDRRPHTGLMEFKNVHRPARIVSYEEKTGKLVLHNYMDFLNLEDYLTIGYELFCDGNLIDEGRIEKNLFCEPHENMELLLPLAIPAKGRCFLRFSYYQLKETEVIPEGFLLGQEEIELKGCNGIAQSLSAMRENLPAAFEDFSLSEDERYVYVESAHFNGTYDKFTAAFKQMGSGKNDLLRAPMEWNIWRAPTDNDATIKRKWSEAGYDRARIRTFDTEVTVEDNALVLKTAWVMNADHIQNFMEATATWRIYEDGRLHLELAAKRDTDFPMLPRFGLRLFLPKNMDRVDYIGIGPQESYVDKHRAGMHGAYKASVSELFEDYIRPQENGSHYDCDRVTVNDGWMELTAVGSPLSFNASAYTAEELTAKAHNYELEESPYTVLCLDYKMNGIGSNSCGPELLPQYRFEDKEFIWSLWLHARMMK